MRVYFSPCFRAIPLHLSQELPLQCAQLVVLALHLAVERDDPKALALPLARFERRVECALRADFERTADLFE